MAPRQKKPTHDDLEKRKKTSFFKQRFPGFKKKAIELSVLSGNSVAFICYGPDNDNLHVWPENPRTLQKLVAEFDGQSDLKRKKNSCDLKDFPQFEGLSVEELKTHLSDLESHLVGVTQKILKTRKKTIKASSKQKEARSGEIGVGISNPKLKPDLEKSVSEDHLKVSDQKLDTKLGFGGVFDELGYVVRGSTTSLEASVSDFEPKSLVVPNDVMEAQDYAPLDPLTLGFAGDESVPVTYDLPMWNWDLDLSSTLADSFMTNTCQTPITDNWGNLQGFQTQPFMWEPLL
ncbi:unnamed protein product [Arabis nemorensis]|uniref:MADS-box domain-containing protein n=1 Tax=Arabis nemorensis TaxID=586526 RepID=A0A565AMY8_9BRAS|nr:unnamed protein product [Arabis nemorensis]